jgi:hypothetical protein
MSKLVIFENLWSKKCPTSPTVPLPLHPRYWPDSPTPTLLRNFPYIYVSLAISWPILTRCRPNDIEMTTIAPYKSITHEYLPSQPPTHWKVRALK